MSKTKVVITVDTEPSIAGAFAAPAQHAPLLHQPVWGEVNGRSEALGFLLRTLTEHGLRATFFVETVHTNYFPHNLMGAYVDKILAAGQDVQLHLHPTWLNFRDRQPITKNQLSDLCCHIGEDHLVPLIRHGCATIESWTGLRPTSMRAGNFAASMSSFRAMKRAGLELGSNICVAVHVPPEPELYVTGGVHSFAGVRELPVTCFSDVGPLGRGRPRPLQLTAVSFAEMTASLNQLHVKGGSIAMLVTHPFEFLKRDDLRYSGMRRNELVQGRFERLCRFLASNHDRFEVVTLAAAANSLPAGSASVPLKGTALRSVVRAAQNYVNDHVK
jgi:hypothetical protein